MNTSLLRLLAVLLGCIALSAPAAIVLSDAFSYSDGVLTNVSNLKWRHSSGAADEVNVTNGSVELTRSENEDVDAALSPTFSASSAATLYSRFSLTVMVLPAGANGNYFAHFAGASARARVFVVTNGAAAGKFRLGIANGTTSASSIWPFDLNTNQSYTLITRLAVSNAQATLWVDPVSVAGASIVAADTASASSANAFAWRQDSGMGTLAVDNLVVATSFGEAISGNHTPSISNVADQQVAQGATAAIPLIIGDAETAAEALSVSVSVSDSNLLQTISLEGAGSNRSVTITASPNQTGTATVTLFVSDATTTNSESFQLTVVPALLFVDDFTYLDGALVTNATPTWTHHSGTVTGQVQVAAGMITLSSTLTEDVSVTLPRGPFAASSGAILYASFRVSFSQLPGSTGDYFAHFNTTGARCRLFASTPDSSGTFRIGIANGASSASAQVPMELSLNTIYLVVLRYEVGAGASTVWINPATETATGATGSDLTTPSSISTFAFRQDPGIGTLSIDELRIGLTFAAVTTQSAPSIKILNTPPLLRISWPADANGFTLEENLNLTTTNWLADSNAVSTADGENFINITNAAGIRFYRLRK